MAHCKARYATPCTVRRTVRHRMRRRVRHVVHHIVHRTVLRTGSAEGRTGCAAIRICVCSTPRSLLAWVGMRLVSQEARGQLHTPNEPSHLSRWGRRSEIQVVRAWSGAMRRAARLLFERAQVYVQRRTIPTSHAMRAKHRVLRTQSLVAQNGMHEWAEQVLLYQRGLPRARLLLSQSEHVSRPMGWSKLTSQRPAWPVFARCPRRGHVTAPHFSNLLGEGTSGRRSSWLDEG